MLGEISNVGPISNGTLPLANTRMTEDFQNPGLMAKLEDILAELAAGTKGRAYAPFSGPRIVQTPGSLNADVEWSFLVDYLCSGHFAP